MGNDHRWRGKALVSLAICLTLLMAGANGLAAARKTVGPKATETAAPAATPTIKPLVTAIPTATATPTATPKATPTAKPTATVKPTATPTTIPTATPIATVKPTATPTVKPTPTVTPTPTPTPRITPTPAPTSTPGFLPMDGIGMQHAVTQTGMRYFADFKFLTQVNEDTVGWLYQEGTELDRPVVQGDDLTAYRTRAFDGYQNGNGSVFMSPEGSAAFLDAGNYLYALDRADTGAFDCLKQYAEAEYYAAHPSALLMTPYADYQVDIFAVVLTDTDDDTSWKVPAYQAQASYDAFVADLRSRSLYPCDESATPEAGERILMLVTCSKRLHAPRYVICGRMRPIEYQNITQMQDRAKCEMDGLETQNGMKQVGPLGQRMVYAQNDPLWSDMRYDVQGNSKYRKFGGGGCGPTAVAMAIANLVDKSQLPLIGLYANSKLGNVFCQCSVNGYYCNHRHVRYQLKTPDEYLRYLPLAVADFATGNNDWGIVSRADFYGTSMSFLEKLCDIYSLELVSTHNWELTLAALRQSDCQVVTMISSSGPFTNTAHYAVLTGADDEYVYVLDPLRRENYKGNDRSDIPDVLTPGVVRVKLEDVRQCCFYAMYIMRKAS